MKKILMYFESMAPAGGVERVISNLANDWCERYEIYILTKDGIKSFYQLDAKIKTISLNRPIKFDSNNKIKSLYYLVSNMILCKKKLREYINEINPDYIYTASPQVSYEIMLVDKKLLDKLVISEHASKNAPNFLFQWMKKKCYPKTYCLSVPTKMDTEEYLKEGCNAVYIPHSASYYNQEKSHLNRKIVLNVGRFTEDKQQLVLLNIWLNIKKKYGLNGWELHLYGKGEMSESLGLYINSNDLGGSVKLMDPVKEIDNVYKSASIFAFTSRMEGFGMVLLEAMAFGLPCISFDCPSGPRDIIIDKYNGFLIDCFNVEDYANKLHCLMNEKNVGQLISMSDNAYSTVQGWSKSDIMQLWDKVFL